MTRKGTLVAALVAANMLTACGSSSGDDASGPEAYEEGDPVKVLSAIPPEGVSSTEADREGRLEIGRGKDYTPIAEDPATLFTRLEKSMADRREVGWQIVEAMLAPQKLTLDNETIDVPLWQTWYEGMPGSTEDKGNFEVAQLIDTYIENYKDCLDQECGQTPKQLAERTLTEFSQKDLQETLTSANFSRTLALLEGLTEGNDKSGQDHLGRGFTIFSPSFVQHVLEQAEGIEKCFNTFPTPASTAPARSPTQFSHCIDEFPRSAVMIKTEWAPIETETRMFDTSGAALSQQLDRINGAWTEGESDKRTTNNIYSVRADDNVVYGLNSIHFSTKDTREWIWVTLWWDPQPDRDFGADRPASIARFNQGVWANYKMCVTSAFVERDPAPWNSFESGQPTLAASLKSTHEVMAKQAAASPPGYREVTTWCSNPFVEGHPNNDKTNCIGCHQFSVAGDENPLVQSKFVRFFDTIWLSNSAGAGIPATARAIYARHYPQFGRSRVRQNFPADFAWSTLMEFPGVIEGSRRDRNFEW